MKKKEYYSFGDPVKLLLRDDCLEILKYAKDGKVAPFFHEFYKDNIKWASKFIRIFPSCYFDLPKRLKSNKHIVRTTINSYKKEGRLKEINISSVPLTLNNQCEKP